MLSSEIRDPTYDLLATFETKRGMDRTEQIPAAAANPGGHSKLFLSKFQLVYKLGV